MDQATPAPSGLGRRRQRLSDAETAERMLAAATALVGRDGLTVSLEHISFEDVIRDAGVSRSAVYRRWPYKDLFFSDLLRELARGASPAIATGNPEAITAVRDALLAHLDWLATPELRIALVAEVLRESALREFDTFHQSADWRTYLALHATFLSLPDGELRAEVQAALTESDRALMIRIAGAYEQATGLLGLRLRPELDATFSTIATLASAAIRGLVTMAPANPAIATVRLLANPFGAPEPAYWSQPALAVATLVLGFLEPDPAIEWTDERTERVRDALEHELWPQ
ncbi:MAG TPA: TetR/AcrR family transcriptional regulator [Pseudonocardiaceae bacterium]|nr:TetR/AcrR family transcriptional regulator [Pseudonocardiaceae bacterium]